MNFTIFTESKMRWKPVSNPLSKSAKYYNGLFRVFFIFSWRKQDGDMLWMRITFILNFWLLESSALVEWNFLCQDPFKIIVFGKTIYTKIRLNCRTSLLSKQSFLMVEGNKGNNRPKEIFHAFTYSCIFLNRTSLRPAK